jgi:hypothetical protein
METIFEDEDFSETCHFCSWRYEFTESHISFGSWRCKYIMSLFDCKFDEHGELIFTKKEIIKQIKEKKK